MRPSDGDVQRWLEAVSDETGALEYVAQELLRARAAEVEKEAKLREAEERARTALGGLGHPSGDVALGIGVLKELYEKCGRHLDEARRERDEARARLRRSSATLHEWTCHNGTADNWQECRSLPCQTDRAALGEKP